MLRKNIGIARDGLRVPGTGLRRVFKDKEANVHIAKGEKVNFFSGWIDTWGQLSVCPHFGAVRTPI
jgi:hypothetical protein